MFTAKTQTEPSDLDKAIAAAHQALDSYPQHSPEYAKILDQLPKLYALKPSPSASRVSPDTLAIVLGNLAVAALVVGHERANVVTSKVGGFLLKSVR